MHQSGIVHRDLKLENVFLDEKFNLKVGDFGFTTQIGSNGQCRDTLGTSAYMPPELKSKDVTLEYDGEKADIFNCGVMLFMLFHAQVYNSAQLRYAKFDTSLPLWAPKVQEPLERPHYWKYYPRSNTASKSFKELFVWMTSRDPAKRPTIEQIRAHSFFSEVCATEDEVFAEQSRRLLLVRANKEKALAEKVQKKTALLNWR